MCQKKCSRNKIKLAVGILLLFNLVSCNIFPDKKPLVDRPSTATAESLKSPTVELNQNWVIVTKEQAEEMRIASWLVESDHFWTPSGDDILKLEEKLAGYLSQNSSQFYRQPPVWERLDAYQRQYIGLERGGRQIIYGNYFCENGGINWRQELVFVIDGGECYFQVEYDMESRLFTELRVNGES